MRSRLLLFVVLVFCVALAATPALAKQFAGTTVSEPDFAEAPVQLPGKLPVQRDGADGAYGFRTVDELTRLISGAPSPSSGGGNSSSGGGASATITVTAIVLPVRTIVVGNDGSVSEIWSNTTDLNGRHSLYVVRAGSIEGPAIELSAEIWADARAAMRTADEATGRIY